MRFEVKIEDQAEFVECWGEKVRGKGKAFKLTRIRRYFVEEAEKLTGIHSATGQQVGQAPGEVEGYPSAETYPAKGT